MDLFVAVSAVFVLVVLVNFLERQTSARFNLLTDWFLLLLNVPIVLVGMLFLVMGLLPASLIAERTPQLPVSLINFADTGLIILAMGVWGMLVSVRLIRGVISRRLPLNPDSPVHTLALILSGALVGNTLFTMAQGGLEGLAESAVSASLTDVLVQQLLFVGLAVLGVGWFIRRDSGKTAVRLGLESLTPAQLWLGIRWMVLLVFMQGLAGAAWAALDPAQYEQFNSLNEQLLGGFDTVAEWLILALASGVGEELLFRGAIQPVFGLTFTAVLFAVAHVQYGLTPVTLVVFLIGVILGYLRERHNTSLCIFVHTGYNLILGLISLIALAVSSS